MDSPKVRGYELAYLIVVPIAWALLLLMHPAPDAGDVFGSLKDVADRWVTVHLGTLVFIGLMGAAIFILLRMVASPAASLARWAAGAFILFYGAGEAISGVATGVLVKEVDADGGSVQILWDNFTTGDLLFLVGAIAWVIAAVSAAVAIRGVGASTLAVVLIGASAIAAYHAPPIGSVGLLLFAGGVIAFARSRTASTTGEVTKDASYRPA